MEIQFHDSMLPDGRTEVSWETNIPREWTRVLSLLKSGIPANGRIYNADTKKWLIAAQYRDAFLSIKAAFENQNEETFAEIDEQLNDEVLASLLDTRLSALPPSMRKRANFAIKAALGLIDAPVQFCVSEKLFGAWMEEERHWVYEDGRYSGNSPIEKDKKTVARGFQRLQKALDAMDGALSRLDEIDPVAFKAKFRAKMLERYEYSCYVCKRRPDDLRLLHMHRVIPGKDGGMYTEDNVVLLCVSCHHKLEGDDWSTIHAYAKENERES